MHFRRPLTDSSETGFPEPAFERILFGQPVSAENLNAAVDDIPQGVTAVQLTDRGFYTVILTPVVLPASIPWIFRCYVGFERRGAGLIGRP